MIVVSIAFAAVAIPMIAGWAVIRNLAAAHHQQYLDDMSALEFARTHPLVPARPAARKVGRKRIAAMRSRAVHSLGRPHSAIMFR